LISEGKYDEALQIAAKQIEDGAPIIDINMDDAMLDSTHEMERFVRCISNEPDVAKAALMIDSSHWETIMAGLKSAQGKCIVNSISLKEGDEAFIEKAKLIKSFGAAVVVMAFDEEGQATTFDRKIEISERAYRLLTETAGFAPSDIIFDVNILSIGTGIEEHAKYAVDFIEAVRWIKANLPGALTSGGVSNLSFAFRGNNAVREAMHSAFLYHAINAGLDMAIVNPSMLQIYDEIEPELLKCVEDVIFDTDSQATERLIDKAARMLAEKENADSTPFNPQIATRSTSAVKAKLLSA
jgi:5-methyltetrahydrofolate--homocysteine methyltransferase